MPITQRTIERFAPKTIGALYAEFAKIRQVKCRVPNLAPPLGGKLEKVSVVLER